MRQFLFLLFLYLPDPILYLMVSIAAFTRSVYRTISNYNLSVESYEGLRGGKSVRMLWIGTDEMKGYILHMLYDSEFKTTKLADTNIFKLKKTIDSLSDSHGLIYVEMNRLLPALSGFKQIPPYLNTIMKLDELNNTECRRIMKIVHEASVEFRAFKVSDDIDKLQLFYEQLYAPHISSKYPEVEVESFDSMRIFYAKGVVLLAYLDGAAIAGSLLLPRGDTLMLCKYGIADAEDPIHRAAGSYYNMISYTQSLGFTQFSSFHARPFLNDGLFRHKRGCGMSFEIERRNYYFDRNLYCRVVDYNRGTIDFLSENPFAFVRDGKLVANVTCPPMDSGIVDEVVSRQSKALTGGIDRYEHCIMQDLTREERDMIIRRCEEFQRKSTIVLMSPCVTS